MPKVPRVILLLENSRRYGRDLIMGIAEYSQRYGPWTFYKEDSFYTKVRRMSKDFKWIRRWGADGIISRDFTNFHELVELDLPIIAVEAFQEKIPKVVEVVSDHYAIAKMASEYFLRRGFRNFAFCGFKDMPWSQKRQEAFSQILSEGGYHVNVFNSKSYRMLSWDKEYPNLIKWLESLPKPTAILCCNDDRAADISEACKTAGLKVPFEAAVLGVDDDEQVCDLANPPLSSISLSTLMAGFSAAKTLDSLMSGQKIDSYSIDVKPVEVHTRQSTDSMAITDAVTAKALEFIKLNNKRLLQVSDVIDAVGCSRKTLDEKFRRTIGHSVFSEIRRVRIESICSMLINTNLPVSEIALYLGYSDADHIARFFKQVKGQTPLEYRKEFCT